MTARNIAMISPMRPGFAALVKASSFAADIIAKYSGTEPFPFSGETLIFFNALNRRIEDEKKRRDSVSYTLRLMMIYRLMQDGRVGDPTITKHFHTAVAGNIEQQLNYLRVTDNNAYIRALEAQNYINNTAEFGDILVSSEVNEGDRIYRSSSADIGTLVQHFFGSVSPVYADTRLSGDARELVYVRELTESADARSVRQEAYNYGSEELVFKTESSENTDIHNIQNIREQSQSIENVRNITENTENVDNSRNIENYANADNSEKVLNVGDTAYNYNTENLTYKTESSESTENTDVRNIQNIREQSQSVENTRNITENTENVDNSRNIENYATAGNTENVLNVGDTAYNYNTDNLTYKTESSESSENTDVRNVQNIQEQSQSIENVRNITENTENVDNSRNITNYATAGNTENVLNVGETAYNYNTENLTYKTESSESSENTDIHNIQNIREQSQSIENVRNITENTENVDNSRNITNYATTENSENVLNVGDIAYNYNTENLTYKTEDGESSAPAVPGTEPESAVPPALKAGELKEIGLLVMNSFLSGGTEYLSEVRNRYIHKRIELTPTAAPISAAGAGDGVLTYAVGLLTEDRELTPAERVVYETAVTEVYAKRHEQTKLGAREKLAAMNAPERTEVLRRAVELLTRTITAGVSTDLQRRSADIRSSRSAGIVPDMRNIRGINEGAVIRNDVPGSGSAPKARESSGSVINTHETNVFTDNSRISAEISENKQNITNTANISNIENTANISNAENTENISNIENIANISNTESAANITNSGDILNVGDTSYSYDTQNLTYKAEPGESTASADVRNITENTQNVSVFNDNSSTGVQNVENAQNITNTTNTTNSGDILNVGDTSYSYDTQNLTYKTEPGESAASADVRNTTENTQNVSVFSDNSSTGVRNVENAQNITNTANITNSGDILNVGDTAYSYDTQNLTYKTEPAESAAVPDSQARRFKITEPEMRLLRLLSGETGGTVSPERLNAAGGALAAALHRLYAGVTGAPGTEKTSAESPAYTPGTLSYPARGQRDERTSGEPARSTPAYAPDIRNINNITTNNMLASPGRDIRTGSAEEPALPGIGKTLLERVEKAMYMPETLSYTSRGRRDKPADGEKARTFAENGVPARNITAYGNDVRNINSIQAYNTLVSFNMSNADGREMSPAPVVYGKAPADRASVGRIVERIAAYERAVRDITERAAANAPGAASKEPAAARTAVGMPGMTALRPAPAAAPGAAVHAGIAGAGPQSAGSAYETANEYVFNTSINEYALPVNAAAVHAVPGRIHLLPLMTAGGAVIPASAHGAGRDGSGAPGSAAERAERAAAARGERIKLLRQRLLRTAETASAGDSGISAGEADLAPASMLPLMPEGMALSYREPVSAQAGSPPPTPQAAEAAEPSTEELVKKFGNLIEGGDAGLTPSFDIGTRGFGEAMAAIEHTAEKVAENSKMIEELREKQRSIESVTLKSSDIDALSEEMIRRLRSRMRFDRSRFAGQ
ncbi:MAG: hypothetical protein K5876_07750 [Ruminiclostridium sp.]|nr:hypothetical protein [Ruminiclostridium sp.]